MRAFAVVSPRFWTGQTGRALKGDFTAQVIALYLITSPHANMLGVYYLPVAYVAHDTGIPLNEAQEGLRRVCATGFADYDEPTEYVWVPNLAREQVGAALKPRDKRVKGILAELRKIAGHPFCRHFIERYGSAYCLNTSDEIATQRSESDGAAEGLPGKKGGAPKVRGPGPGPGPGPDPCADPGSEPASVAARDDGEPASAAVFDLYDEARTGTDWAACQKRTASRASAARARLRDFGVDGLREAFAQARRSRFLTDPAVRNASADHATWRPDIEWFLRPDTVPRILEGKYDNRAGELPAPDTPDRRAHSAELLECAPEDLLYDEQTGDYIVAGGER